VDVHPGRQLFDGGVARGQQPPQDAAAPAAIDGVKETLHQAVADPTAEIDPEGLLIVNAWNGFNKLNQKAMLWTCWLRWCNGSWCAFNCYRHSSILILRRQGENCEIILSREGVMQGDPLAMIMYGVDLLPPLSESL
jgi:hypothetical protein